MFSSKKKAKEETKEAPPPSGANSPPAKKEAPRSIAKPVAGKATAKAATALPIGTAAPGQAGTGAKVGSATKAATPKTVPAAKAPPPAKATLAAKATPAAKVVTPKAVPAAKTNPAKAIPGTSRSSTPKRTAVTPAAKPPTPKAAKATTSKGDASPSRAGSAARSGSAARASASRPTTPGRLKAIPGKAAAKVATPKAESAGKETDPAETAAAKLADGAARVAAKKGSAATGKAGVAGKRDVSQGRPSGPEARKTAASPARGRSVTPKGGTRVNGKEGKNTKAAAAEETAAAPPPAPANQAEPEPPASLTTDAVHEGLGMLEALSGMSTGKSGELLKFVACFEPLAGKTEAAAALRTAGFRSADPNGNGLCSLAEIEGFVLKTLLAAHPKTGNRLTGVKEPGRDVFDAFRPCYIRAFNNAKDYKADSGTVLEGTKNSTADDFVSKGEFRLLCAYLCIYATMFDAFSKIDGGGAGRVGDDRRVDMAEWMGGFRTINEHGFVALSALVNDKLAEAAFKAMDGNGGGVVLLDEFCEYLQAAEVAAHTAIGRALAEDEEGGAANPAKKAKPAAKKAAGPPPPPKLVEQEAWKDLGEVKADVESAGRRQAMLKATRLKLEAHKAAREKTTAGINAKLGAIGMPVVEPKPFVPNPKVKRTAALPAPKPVSAWVRKAPAHSGAVPTPGKSGELLKFVACFEPLAGKTEAAAALRTAGFRSADPNGNGLCSLAEIEGFVLKTLLAAHPKTGKGDDTKEPGRDIFDAFRPCYIRAFNDAKDYKADSGTVLEGTKNSTADDFVSKGEFRLLCAYLCIYATMFDAFSKIDGGGAGRDAGDDRRVDLDEWMHGYKGVASHGLVALAHLANDKLAEAAFRAMDGNGGGVVLLGEFCDYVKAAEVAAHTCVGRDLAEDEHGGVGKPDPVVAGAVARVGPEGGAVPEAAADAPAAADEVLLSEHFGSYAGEVKMGDGPVGEKPVLSSSLPAEAPKPDGLGASDPLLNKHYSHYASEETWEGGGEKPVLSSSKAAEEKAVATGMGHSI